MFFVRQGDELVTPDGEYKLRTHARNADCDLGCAIHNPSNHFMNRANWRYNWRFDRGILERLDPELGVGHPDPDGLAYLTRIGEDAKVAGNHGCWIRNGYMACSEEAWND